MNRSERAEIKQIILTRIDLLSEKQLTEKLLSEEGSHLAQTLGDKLRLERLETALMRVDAENFGECFKCEKSIAMSRLRIMPESVICTACLEDN